MKIAINGFGRIGRTALRVLLERGMEKRVVAVNDLTDAVTLAALLKYDSNYGHIGAEITGENFETIVDEQGPVGSLMIDGHEIHVFSQKDPTLLPWKDLNIDVVIESTGRFVDEEGAGQHLKAGAKRVVLSAPAKEGSVKTIVMGVNTDKLTAKDQIISNASCTTNCISPVAQLMVEHFGVKKAMMTTTHGYTADQNLQDGPHKDLRRARSAPVNIVPTSTGATIAAAEVVPELKGLFAGVSLRVPVPVGSISDFTFLLKRKTTVAEINDVFKKASKSARYKGILAITEDPIVSSDIIGDPHSAIVDLGLTQVLDGDFVKVFAWYDNEFGYCNRLIDEVELLAKHLK
jgi:glyceraldehyde 3-phosphate dehydrogenase